MAKNCASGILTAVAYAAFGVDHAHADGPFNFSQFSSSPVAQQPAPEPAKPQAQPAEPRARNDNSRTTSAGFDPEALERGVKALKEISSSSHAKKVFESSHFVFFYHFGVLVLKC